MQSVISIQQELHSAILTNDYNDRENYFETINLVYSFLEYLLSFIGVYNRKTEEIILQSH